MSTDNCSRCHYFQAVTPPGHPQPQGSCNKLPPIPMVLKQPNGAEGVITAWPTVLPHQWCGSFEESHRIDLNTKIPAVPSRMLRP